MGHEILDRVVALTIQVPKSNDIARDPMYRGLVSHDPPIVIVVHPLWPGGHFFRDCHQVHGID